MSAPTGSDHAIFPPRAIESVRVDSVAEEYAFLDTYPPSPGVWSVVSQGLSLQGDVMVDRMVIRSEGATMIEEAVEFELPPAVTASGGDQPEMSPSARLDLLMRNAVDFARNNPPFHPGSLPRFPVPSDRHAGSVDVPLAILAVGDEGRSLYAPARFVTLRLASGEPLGVGEMPGFDPDQWPPQRLGSWPPVGIRMLDHRRLQGTISRFGSCYTRLLDAVVLERDYRHRGDEVREVRALLGRLDLPAMLAWYRRLAPAWSDAVLGADEPSSSRLDGSSP